MALPITANTAAICAIMLLVTAIDTVRESSRISASPVIASAAKQSSSTAIWIASLRSQ
jgi:hypothetical protein